ncbi:hypothetical protein K0U00_27850, partial [Paenibacillus sepulcri]|nr:hypothetical protein [Paenibacillus sepulcri]
KVAHAKRLAADFGMSNTQVSRLVSGTIAEIADRVLRGTGQNRILAAGGDTSAAICSRLGISGMRIYREIEPGLPSSLSLSRKRPLMLVLKSGSFGGPDFFEKAIEHMKSRQDRL